MTQLWSPWRSEFIHSEKPDTDESPFARAWREPERDAENYLVYRGELAFIIMNRYPYNAGHLLVVPVRQVGDILDLTDEESYEMMELIRFGVDLLRRAFKPDAMNIGMNLGKTAGAGIETHAHFHIVPRWNGDTNFMPVLADVRVISENMEEAYRKLREVIGGR